MILLAALLLGLLAGWGLARGHGRAYRPPEPRHLWLIAAAFLPQLLVAYLPATRELVPASMAALALPVSFAVFLVFTWLNRRISGMPILMTGLLLNLLVITANGGWMPISPETASQLPGGSPPESAVPGTRIGQKDSLVRPEDTRLQPLSDQFLLPAWLGYRAAFSLGDVFVAAGAFWLLASPSGHANTDRSENADIQFTGNTSPPDD